MFARLTIAQVKPEKLDESMQKYKDINIPEISSHKGFQSAYFLTNRRESKIIALSFWDSEEAALAREQTEAYREAHTYIPEMITTPPVREGYEVSVRS